MNGNKIELTIYNTRTEQELSFCLDFDINLEKADLKKYLLEIIGIMMSNRLKEENELNKNWEINNDKFKKDK